MTSSKKLIIIATDTLSLLMKSGITAGLEPFQNADWDLVLITHDCLGLIHPQNPGLRAFLNIKTQTSNSKSSAQDISDLLKSEETENAIIIAFNMHWIDFFTMEDQILAFVGPEGAGFDRVGNGVWRRSDVLAMLEALKEKAVAA